MLYLQHRTQIADIIDQYFVCQETEIRKIYLENRAILFEIEECSLHEDMAKFTYA